MDYGENLLTNPSAETGDTTGWTAVDVTVEGGTTGTVELKPDIGEKPTILLDRWFENIKPQLAYQGATGTYYFLLASTASLSQAVLEASLTPLPDVDFRVTVDFRLTTAQDLEDAEVKGWVEIEILYSDETKDLFVVPCVKGIGTDDRTLSNNWLRATADCDIRQELGITSITITAKTNVLTDGLKIDQIKLEKNLETDEGLPIGEEGEVLIADEDGKPVWSSRIKSPVFVFNIKGYLATSSSPCIPLPIPYNCTIDEVYIYCDIAPEGGYPCLYVDIMIADEDGENEESVFPTPYQSERPHLDTGEHHDEATPRTTALTKNKVIYPSIDLTEYCDEETPGADLCIEVRCL